ncbi:DUF4326 domain-containing protein [Streptomyces rubradiris]|uniref:DUF4326 domain-containing protein n=1 Tax=Streptomyces rubradiris TaxID=285531 RepID=UPI0036E0D851
MSPARIQRRRTKGWRAPEHAVYVGRPTRYGNPFLATYQQDTGGWHVERPGHVNIGTFPSNLEARRFATDVYRVWINQPQQTALRNLAHTLLHGRDLLCWCPLPEPGQPDHCHAAVLLELANRETP